MSKQTMVMVLSEHKEIFWDHDRGTAFCGGCDTELCAMNEPMSHQEWRLREHQADEMIAAGLGLVREAQVEAWEAGVSAGWDYFSRVINPALAYSGFNAKRPKNPYTD